MDDIDQRAGIVRVRRGKGDRERRTPLTSAACQAIAVYVRDVRSRWAPVSERALFVTKRGTPMTTWTLRAMLEYHERRARFMHASTHAFRHAAATHMVSSGVD
jgi:integrase/recombinase XerD